MQTFTDYELILIDDGSTDNSGKICDCYAVEDQRIRVIHQENRGVSAARNVGIENSGGGYIAFIDSDDWIHPFYFEYLMRAIIEYEVDAATLNNVWTKEYYNPIITLYDDIDKVVFSGEEIRKNFYNMVYDEQYRDVVTCGLYGLYKKKIFDDVRFDEKISIGEDIEVMSKISLEIKPILHLSEKMYFYFTGNTGATRQEINPKQLTDLLSLSNTIEITRDNRYGDTSTKFEYRLVYRYLNLVSKIDATNDRQLRWAIKPYRKRIRNNYLRFCQNTYLSFEQKICLLCEIIRFPKWRLIFGHIENEMMRKLDSFIM